MAIQRKKIQALVRELLAINRVKHAPVPVRKVAKSQGARIVLDALEADLSGFLFRDQNEAIIGVNTHQARVRQNFTIAHELGHLLLHDRQHEQLHVDRKFSVRLRSVVSSRGIDEAEMEANYFAAELLMPADFIEADVQSLMDDNADLAIQKLSEKYNVSREAMSIRLSALNYVRL
jgi:Zn-dependent peptidase ImmA (M78 family)